MHGASTQPVLDASARGYKHLPGARATSDRRPRDRRPERRPDRDRTYTYKLRDGIKFGPPVNRAVTSQDVAYAMNRLANPKDGGQYSFYYTVSKAGTRSRPARPRRLGHHDARLTRRSSSS